MSTVRRDFDANFAFFSRDAVGEFMDRRLIIRRGRVRVSVSGSKSVSSDFSIEMVESKKMNGRVHTLPFLANTFQHIHGSYILRCNMFPPANAQYPPMVFERTGTKV